MVSDVDAAFVSRDTKRIVRCRSASGLMLGRCDNSGGWEANQGFRIHISEFPLLDSQIFSSCMDHI